MKRGRPRLIFEDHPRTKRVAKPLTFPCPGINNIAETHSITLRYHTVPTMSAPVALTAAEEAEIAECDRIVEFARQVMAGEHPRINIPERLVSYPCRFLRLSRY